MTKQENLLNKGLLNKNGLDFLVTNLVIGLNLSVEESVFDDG